MKELLLAGKVNLIRVYCNSCEDFALIDPSQDTCPYCGLTIYYNDFMNIKKRKITTNSQKRSNLSKTVKLNILIDQNFKCYWCGREFGQEVYRKKKFSLKYHFDHVLPYAYCGHNGLSNFVASCSVCNQWKSDKVFKNEEICREFLVKKWENGIKSGHILENISRSV